MPVLQPGHHLRMAHGRGHAGGCSHGQVAVAPRWLGMGRATPPRPPAADDATAARLGQAVHRCWSGSAVRPSTGQPCRSAEWAAASRRCRPGHRAAAAAPRVLALASRVLQSPDCQRFFGGPALRWAGNEVPVAWQGEAQRIDRLVRWTRAGRTVWWVLDYKLQADPAGVPAYREQLQGYVAAVKAAAAGRRGAGRLHHRGRVVVPA
jgi:ATP-dependent helicase/nuclease subunit A